MTKCSLISQWPLSADCSLFPTRVSMCSRHAEAFMGATPKARKCAWRGTLRSRLLFLVFFFFTLNLFHVNISASLRLGFNEIVRVVKCESGTVGGGLTLGRGSLRGHVRDGPSRRRRWRDAVSVCLLATPTFPKTKKSSVVDPSSSPSPVFFPACLRDYITLSLSK